MATIRPASPALALPLALGCGALPAALRQPLLAWPAPARASAGPRGDTAARRHGSARYAEHVAVLNKRFAAEGKPPLKITPAPEILEDGDILEMVNAGLAPATVVDDLTADLYTQVFPNLRKHSDIASPPGDIAWAFRKDSPKLAAAVNAFAKGHGQGTLAGNVLINKYLKSTAWVKNARSDEDNVELVAAKRIGRETVTYVSNIYKYYLAYQMMVRATRRTTREGGRREALA